MKRISVLLLVALFVAGLAVVPNVLAQGGAPGNADLARVDLGAAPAALCQGTGAAVNIPITLNAPDNTPRSFTFAMSAPFGGQVVAQGSQNFTGPFTNQTQTLSLSPASYNLAPNSTIGLIVRTYSGADGTGDLLYSSHLEFNCTTGASVSDVGAFMGNSFVLRTITCNTPVYDAPGGAPIPNTLIRAGQTWFVNPFYWVLQNNQFVNQQSQQVVQQGVTQEQNQAEQDTQQDTTQQDTTQQGVTQQQNQAQQGQQGQAFNQTGTWTEIFVGSANLGYIPANCVGTYPGILGIDVQPQNQQNQQDQNQDQNQQPTVAPTVEATAEATALP